MHIFVNCDLLQPEPMDEVISVGRGLEPDMAVKEPLKESATPTDMLQSSEVASSHQLLSQVDMEHPVIDCLLLDAAPDVQPSCFDES